MRIALMFAGVITLAAQSVSAQTVDRSEVQAMVGWINQARAERGIGPLTEDSRLDAVSEAHSMDMATHNFFSHVSPTLGAPDQRAQRAGIGYVAWAENIAQNQSARAAMDALLQSPGHYQNITNAGIRTVGIGIVHTARGVYVTQSFATLDPNAPSAPVRLPASAQPVLPAQPAQSAQQAPVATNTAPDPDDCDVDPQTGDCDDSADTQQAPANNGWTLPGITGNSLPNLGTLARVPGLPSLQSLPSGNPIQVRPAPRDANGNPNWDVQTPMGTVRVMIPGDPNQAAGITSLLNQLMGMTQNTQPPAAPAATTPAHPARTTARPTAGRVVEVELPPVPAAPRAASRRARQTAPVAPTAPAGGLNSWTGDF